VSRKAGPTDDTSPSPHNNKNFTTQTNVTVFKNLYKRSASVLLRFTMAGTSTTFNRRLFVWVLFMLISSTTLIASAFSVTQRRIQIQPRCSTTTCRASIDDAGDDDDDYSPAEVSEMEELIISLADEETDDSRRSRLTSVFEQALAKPDAQRFSDLFDQSLIRIGEAARQVAQQKAMAIHQQQQIEESKIIQQEQVDEEPEIIGNLVAKQKTKDERQLWSLVDMMVQSKTLVRARKGKLGSEGTFG
jgi:hypothetical protein